MYVPMKLISTGLFSSGINQPRQLSCKGGPLPSPRTISNVIHKSGHCSLPSRRLTVLAMQFGQFIEHDVISTPLQRGMFHYSLKSKRVCLYVVYYNPFFVKSEPILYVATFADVVPKLCISLQDSIAQI